MGITFLSNMVAKKLLIIAGIILIIASLVVLIEYIRYTQTMEVLNESINLLQEGKYEEGLDHCGEAHYFQSTCYVTLLGMKLGHNQTITNADCAGLIDDSPFWSSNNGITYLHSICDCLAAGNSKEICESI